MTVVNSQHDNPLVSILIPCHNAERWVGQCIESALGQTYDRKEIVVVDDGSTDTSARIVESFGNRIRFERLSHVGANAARNRLLELSKGSWLQYLDADDYLLPEKVEKQVLAVARPGCAADIIFSPVLVRYEQTGRKVPVDIDQDADPALNFIRWGPYSTISVLFRRETLGEIGGWTDSQPCCQEHELFLRMIIAGKRFEFLSHVGSVYRIHGPNSISHRDPELVIRTRMSLTDRMIEHLEKTGAKTRKHEIALYIARMESARTLYPIDRDLALQFFAKAMECGPHFVRSSPALPVIYQIATAVSGPEQAEVIAAWWRRRRVTAEA